MPHPVPEALGRTEVHDRMSHAVQDTFRIFVGHCGDDPVAMLFVTDGNGLFGLAVDTVRLMQIPALVPSMLVVGIGYPDAAVITDAVAQRTRDFTPTASPHFPGSGGADAFVQFLREELLPWMGALHPSCMRSRLYFGHSLGGLFGVHTLLTAPDTFTDYLIASPSLWWDNHRLLDAEELPAAGRDLAANVYVGIGSEETDQGRRREGRRLPDGHPMKPPPARLDMVEDLERFAVAVVERRYPGLQLEVRVFHDEFHATVAGAVLSHGLRHVFASS